MDSIYEGVQGGGILEDTGEEGLLGLGSGESLYGLGKRKGLVMDRMVVLDCTYSRAL